MHKIRIDGVLHEKIAILEIFAKISKKTIDNPPAHVLQ